MVVKLRVLAPFYSYKVDPVPPQEKNKILLDEAQYESRINQKLMRMKKIV